MPINYSKNKKRYLRRGLDDFSSKILHLIFTAHPEKVTLPFIAKSLKIEEKTSMSLLKKIQLSEIPILISKNKKNEIIVQGSMNEPISWILKEKESAEGMLALIKDLKIDNNDPGNRQKKITYRIYDDYVRTLNEVFDKWNSLKLFEKINKENCEF